MAPHAAGSNQLEDGVLRNHQLLVNVAEELKIPLIQIAHLSELADTNTASANAGAINAAAMGGLNLLNNYITGLRLSLSAGENINAENLEAVNVSAVLYETGQALGVVAKNYGVELNLTIAGKFGPVTVNRAGLQAALTSLGTALIEALPAQDETQLKLHLATHRSRYGIVAGLYANTPQLTREALKRGRRLLSSSRQPVMNMSHTNAAGIFIADSILKAMNLKLTPSRHRHLYGLGTVLRPNHQLQLV